MATNKAPAALNVSASTPLLRSMLSPQLRQPRPGDNLPGVRFSKQTSRRSIVNKKDNPNERRFEN